MLPYSRIRVVVVRRQILFREALGALLASQPDFEITALVPTINDALRITQTTPVRCAVVEFRSAEINIASFASMLSDLSNQTKILLTGDVLRLQDLETLRPVVAGILSNTSNAGALIEAIRMISAGESWKELPDLDGSSALPHHRYSPVLTSRQQKVLHLVCEGLSNKECAHIVGVSDSSVKCTIQQLFVKTNTRSRAQLVRRAMEDLPDVMGSLRPNSDSGFPIAAHHPSLYSSRPNPSASVG